MSKQLVTFEQHPIAAQYTPGTMRDEEFEAFADDIKSRGQIHDAIIHEGKMLDGMSRQKACVRNGMTLRTKPYTGSDPTGFVIALNLLRRKSGATQRALAGARLNIDHSLTQDDASKRVGVSKVHVSLVVQAIKSNNARVLKMLEDPDLTRERLHEELVDCGIITSGAPRLTAAPHLSAAGASAGLDSLFANRTDPGDGEEEDEDLDDLLGGAPTELGVDLEETLGAPPSANGKVISFKPTSEGGMPTVGEKPKHPERLSRETPASLLAEKFRGFTEAEQVSFMQITWPLQRKLLKTAGLSIEGAAPAATEATPAPVTAPSKRTSAQAAAAAADAIGKAAAKAASKPAKVLETEGATSGTPKGRKTA